MTKYKDKDAWKNTTRRYGQEQKNKLLTTSPVIFDRSHSTSQKKSKERSVSKIHTHRSQYAEKDMLKNVTRKLYTQNKEVHKDKSNSKSKSKSKSKSRTRTRIHTDRDVSPIRDVKKPKAFNVADR